MQRALGIFVAIAPKRLRLHAFVPLSRAAFAHSTLSL